MKLSIALIYVAFYGAIAFACYILKSGWPLLAMILTPTVHASSKDSSVK